MKNYTAYTLYADGSWKWLRYPHTTKRSVLRSHAALVGAEERRGNKVTEWFVRGGTTLLGLKP